MSGSRRSFDRALLVAHLTRDEGRRTLAYVDTTGNVSGGVGRNLSTRGLSDPEIDMLLDNDIDLVVAQLDARLPWWRGLDPVRQLVLANMAFNLGIAGLLSFVHFLAAVQAGDWPGAVAQMRASLWAKQVGQRAVRLEAMMLLGVVGA